MSLSKNDLKALKEKIRNKNPDVLSRIKSLKKSPVEVKTIKKENFSQKKEVVVWNFKPNQLIRFKRSSGKEGLIGLIVSDFEYFSEKVEKNCFFVLVENRVIQFDGRYLQSI